MFVIPGPCILNPQSDLETLPNGDGSPLWRTTEKNFKPLERTFKVIKVPHFHFIRKVGTSLESDFHDSQANTYSLNLGASGFQKGSLPSH